MKIGYDYISTVGGGGNAYYSQNLIKNLKEIDKENQYFLYIYWHDYLRNKKPSELNQLNFKVYPSYFTRWKLPIPNSFFRGLNGLNLKLWSRINKIEVIHFTNPLNFVFGLKKSVVTIHDLAAFYQNDWIKKNSYDFFKKNIERILKESKKIISVSEFTKSEIIKRFKVSPAKIVVIPEAAAAEFYPETDEEYLKNKFDLTDYLLFVGQLQPRKNIIKLIEAFSHLPSELTTQYKLILVGLARDQKYLKQLNCLIKKTNLIKQIILLGRVSSDDLRKIYSQAKIFIYPSLYEGFGLPVLEAMACQTPVITSNTSSLAEVGGEAAFLVNPENSDEIKSAMEKLLTNHDLYNNYKARCLEQAKKFTWRNSAEMTLKVYQSLNE